MANRYYIVRFIENLARGETKNIGVFYEGKEHISARFLGEKSNGSLDLRSVKPVVSHTPTYRQWIDYWKRTLSEQDPTSAMRNIISSAKGNFAVQEGERIFVPQEMSGGEDATLSYLFNLLVGDFPNVSEEDFLQKSLTEKCNEIIRRYRLRRDPHFSISPTVPLTIEGTTVHLKPSYHWLNGRDIYYQKVTINEDRMETTQKDVTSATWVLGQLKEHNRDIETRALVKLADTKDSSAGDGRSEEYMSLLSKYSDSVIDVDDEKQVEMEFSSLHM